MCLSTQRYIEPEINADVLTSQYSFVCLFMLVFFYIWGLNETEMNKVQEIIEWNKWKY